MPWLSTLIVVGACIATAFATLGLSRSDTFEARSALQRTAVLVGVGGAIGFLAQMGSSAHDNAMIQVVTLLLLSALVIVHFARGDAPASNS